MLFFILSFPTSHGIIHFAMGFHRYKPFLYPRITTKRAGQEKDSDFSLANERWEQALLTPREDNGPLFQGLSPG